MKRRKLISVLLAATMMAAMFAGCGSDAASTDAKENADGADSTEAGGVKEFTAFLQFPVQRSMTTMRFSRSLPIRPA